MEGINLALRSKAKLQWFWSTASPRRLQSGRYQTGLIALH